MSNQQKPPLFRKVISATMTDNKVIAVAQDGTMWLYRFNLGRWEQLPALPDSLYETKSRRRTLREVNKNGS